MWTQVLYVAGWALAFDALRRPGWQWTAADRSRPFWVVMLGLVPIIGIPFYLPIVVPRLAASRRAVWAEFLKQ